MVSEPTRREGAQSDSAHAKEPRPPPDEDVIQGRRGLGGSDMRKHPQERAVNQDDGVRFVDVQALDVQRRKSQHRAEDREHEDDLSRTGPSPGCLPASHAVHRPGACRDRGGWTRGETDTHVENYAI